MDQVLTPARLEGRGLLALHQADAGRFQVRGSRRPGVGIRAGNFVAGFGRNRRYARHEGAADSEDVYVHGVEVL